MDPNANLKEQESLILYRTTSLIQTPAQRRDRNARLQELRDALSLWLKKGGFAPNWALAPHARRYYRR